MTSTSENLEIETVKEKDSNESWYEMSVQESEYLKDHLNEMLKPLNTVENLKSPMDGLISNDVNNEKSFLFDNKNASPAKSSPELILFNSSDSFLDFDDTLDTKTEPLDNLNNGSVDQNGIIKKKSNSINGNIDPKIYDKNEQFSSDLETHKNYTYHDIPLPPEEDSKSSLLVLVNPVLSNCENGEQLKEPEETNYVLPQEVFEKEKTDIVDPRWESIKELTSNEQRYKQVKKCWGSSTVPDPDKNLTYHSYRRKKWLRSGEPKEKVQQRKRKATTSLNNEIKKPCTYLVDKEINKVKIEKDEENRVLQFEMKRTIDELRQHQVQEELCYSNSMAFKRRNYGNFFSNSLQGTFIPNSRHELRMQINDVRNTYKKRAYDCDSKYISRLESLKGIREEVLQFYKFYKGLGINAEKDPTLLTDLQFKMLDDVENFYKQMENFYK